MAGFARFRGLRLEIGAVGREGERDFAGKLRDGAGRRLIVEPEAADHERDARTPFRGRRRGPSIDLRRAGAVWTDARERAEIASLDKARIGCRRKLGGA